ncbi:phage tail tape measure protein [Halalkalibacterium halodurans]|uniref:phage tail tape measure protein n=1 Tax=Halalkalibacterium halodurans TaxID=86665 RepID=UPI002E1C65FB|nr:phage tail tape measure protein [Halalkalibacterium halodurans]MED3647774.1 phage tail tape measure protein [Halalkalibacterium halodurans]
MANTVEVTIQGIDEATKVFEQVGKEAEKSFSSVEKSIEAVDESILNVSDLDLDTSQAEASLDATADSVDGLDESVSNMSDLDIETSEAEAGIEGVSSGVDDLDGSISNIADLDIDTSGAESGIMGVVSNVEELDGSVSNVSSLEVDTAGAESSIEGVASSVSQLDESVSSVADLQIDTSGTMTNLEGVLSSIDELDRSVTGVSALDIDTSGAESDVDSLISSVNDLDMSASSVSDIEIETGSAEAGVESTTSAVNDLNNALEETDETAKSFSERFKEGFDSAADNFDKITVGAGGAGLAVEAFSRTQGETNATLERLSMVTGESTESLRDSADAMTNHTFATSDAVAGMEMLIQRGIDTKEEFEAILPHVDDLADATGKDFTDALNSADRLLKPFGDNLNDVGDNVDQMARLMMQTDVPIGMLEKALGRVPNELQALEFGLDDAAAGIEVFRDRGFSGQEAVKQFREAVEASEGDMGAFLEALGLTNEQWEEYQRQVEPSIDLAAEMAEVNNEQMTVMEKLQQNVENLMTKYGGFAEAANLLVPIMLALGPAIKGVQMATALFNATLWASPITWIVAAIIGLIAVIWLLWNNWDEVSQFLSDSWEWIKEVAGNVFGWIGDFLSDTWDWIKETSMNIWNSIKDFLSGLWDGIKDKVSTVFESISNVISNIWDTIKNVTSNIWNGIKNTISNIWDGIKNIVSNVINSVRDTIDNVWNKVKSITSNAWNGLRDTVTDVINSVKSRVDNTFNTIKNTIEKAWNKTKEITDNIWDSIVDSIKGAINGVIKAINGIIDGINSIEISVPKIPDWVPGLGGSGGGSIGFPNVPKIPSLATGGVVSSPTLAVVGDAGRGNPEIVAPQKMISSIVGNELKKYFSEFAQGSEDTGGQERTIEINVPLYIDGKEVARATARYNDRELGKIGKRKARSRGEGRYL